MYGWRARLGLLTSSSILAAEPANIKVLEDMLLKVSEFMDMTPEIVEIDQSTASSLSDLIG